MFIDLIVIILLIFAIFKGLRNGLVVAVFSFLAFVIGLAAALKLSTVVAEYLGTNTNISQRWLPVLAFAIVFLIVVFLVRLGAKAIDGVLRLVMLGWLNKIGGLIFYTLLYLFIFSIILFYTVQLNIIKPETLEASTTYYYIQPIGPKVISALGIILPFFKDMFAELELFFGGLAGKEDG
jgi:membrane protein required for colicin V production